MDKTTFYRNVTRFEEEEILYSIEGIDRRRYYEVLSKTNHAHFICKECKEIECLELVDLKLNNYNIEDITLKGTCQSCQENLKK